MLIPCLTGVHQHLSAIKEKVLIFEAFAPVGSPEVQEHSATFIGNHHLVPLCKNGKAQPSLLG